jgi:hypothetical protein
MTSALRWIFDLPHDALDGADEWGLRLTGVPENLWILMGVLVAFGLLAWLVVRTYQREGRSGSGVKMAIATVRLTVLAVLLLVALQPALYERNNKVLRSEIVVLLDDTLSMRWMDRYQEPADRAGLAAFLGSTQEGVDGPSRPTRLSVVKHAVSGQGGALAKLAAEHPIVVYRFGLSGPNYMEEIKPFMTGPAPAYRFDAMEAAGIQTNISRALREALDRLEGRRVAGIVLLSDGQNTSSAGAAARMVAARNLLKDRGVPVWCVAVGDPTPPRNILVAQLQGPGDVRKGSVASFTAVLTNRSYGGTDVEVELLKAPVGSEEWETAAAPVAVNLQAGTASDDAGKVQEIALRAEATEVGEFVYKARVKPRPDEMIVTDNEATTTVRISDEKVNVLLVSGDAGWEFQYLRNYLLRHPEHYKVSVWQQNADRGFNQEASSGMKLDALPLTKDDLFRYDVVILYDPRPDPDLVGLLTPPPIASAGTDKPQSLIEQFVNDHHGGLCYIVGNKFTDANILGGGPFDTLTRLLPVQLARQAGGFSSAIRAKRIVHPIELTGEGGDHPMMALGITADDTRKVWESLPGVYQNHAVARAKTLASSLLASGDTTRQTVDGQREPIIAIQYYGKGRVLYHGFDSTWRWRLVDDLKIYQKYWGNAIDFLSAGRLQKKRILITAGGEAFDAGTEIRVRVEAYNQDFTPMQAKSFPLIMAPLANAAATKPSGRATEFELSSSKTGFYEGNVLAERTGMFLLRPKPGAGDWLEDDVAPKRIEVRLPEEEFKRPEANYQMLKELAEEESRFLRIWEIDQLDRRVPPDRLTASQEKQYPIWNKMAVLVLLGVLLLAEWTFRKLKNMV